MRPDVARKFLQMEYARSRRYVKYEDGNKSRPRETLDPEKERRASRFHKKWRVVEDAEYLQRKKEHRGRNERG